MKERIYTVTLGCPKNQVDTERALWRLRAAGAEFTTAPEEADVLLVNTCGFITGAKQESIDVILELAEVKKKNPRARLAVMGCLAERYRAELAERIPEIDVIAGVGDKAIAAKLIPGAVAPMPDPDYPGRIITTAPHWAYLKIAEGCSNQCSFCAIPRIRGPFASRPMDEVTREARALAPRGVKELILVAQDSALYGADLHLKRGLPRLLEQLNDIAGLVWIRVMYLYPPLVDRGLIERMATLEKVVPYFDLPFQHASGAVLTRMNRPETNDYIRRLIGDIRGRIPHAALRTAFITGFPGETDKDFKILRRLVEEARFDHMGVFTYSPEEGTAAYDLGGAVSAKTADSRRDELMSMQRAISAEKLAGRVGEVIEVMADG
ncbi:MAG: 30S ribosomal protein S12 methylthiotransferase RimO, partial [Nitrospinae bacterium]|nr:30S ribosomal protein S12 methylthiotransferase RimO [Nitrospinota bacterium]